MGEQKVTLVKDKEQMARFVRQLLDDVQALEYMLNNDWFESDIIRIGAEQEMCLVNRKNYKPAPIAMEVLDKMKEFEWVETELARFNLEIGLSPRVFSGNCFSEMENEIRTRLQKIEEILNTMDSSMVLTGILPTLKKFDLEMHNLTPKKRYKALMDAIHDGLLKQSFELRLTGIDELLIKHDSPLLEACNTSFQVHLQVAPKDFVRLYNISQVLAAPVMSIAANSPVVFGKRLWHESRIALFQQALDTRATHEYMRERRPRVSFGRDWIKNSIMEIYKEDIARFRVLISGDKEENSLEMIENGKVPKLRALQIHNSTVYRWNRPCYGISDTGKPHLRIENRVLASGPTIIDEMANAAFWLGLMVEMGDLYKDITQHISFHDIRDNFGKAARYGIDTTFTWLNDQKISPCDLILEQLIPIAREGMIKRGVNEEDMVRYLDIIQMRAEKHMTGARWQLRAYTQLMDEVDTDEALSVLTSSIVKNQQGDLPVHDWPTPHSDDLKEYKPSRLKVEEFMSTDLFTVHKEDIVDIVAEMMNWRKVRYMPVEDNKGNLVGLCTSRLLLRHFVKCKEREKPPIVESIMIKEPITIDPDATIIEAMGIMRENKIGCLPVVSGKELVGIITEMDFLRISSRLIERLGH